MGVRVVRDSTAQPSSSADFVRVRTCSDPFDDTVTLATIQRVVGVPAGPADAVPEWRVRDLVTRQPMTLSEAVGLAMRYAERKHIPVVYADTSDGAIAL